MTPAAASRRDESGSSARKKRADEELAKTPHMVELAMRKKYGSLTMGC